MGDVIAFLPKRLPKQEDSPSLYGEAICLACQHRWMASSSGGEVYLNCPSCKTQRGVFRYPIGPNDTTQMYQCLCGCNTFVFASEDHQPLVAICLACGQHHSPGQVSILGLAGPAE